MMDVPLRSISVSDFRRLAGHRVLPLDAPVVLVHGANGMGKTSVLSALEMALTGEVRSMRRHDARYTAHLPFHGQPFTAVSVTVAEALRRSSESTMMTIGGSRIDGDPALSPEGAQFYSERCYLDQTSLGQLLELYQYREGKEASALSRFVNELLGLEELDALHAGLDDAADIRRLRKLSDFLVEAESEVKVAREEVERTTEDLVAARRELAGAEATLSGHMVALAAQASVDSGAAEPGARDVLSKMDPEAERAAAERLNMAVTDLGARLKVLGERPSTKELQHVNSQLDEAVVSHEQWREQSASRIDEWRTDLAAADISGTGLAVSELEEEIRRVQSKLERQIELKRERASLDRELQNAKVRLADVKEEQATAQQSAGSLVEGLGTVREHTFDNVCPVCDRDYGEVASEHLTAHVDAKVAELTGHGERLRALRRSMDALLADVNLKERSLLEVESRLLSPDEYAELEARAAILSLLWEGAQELKPVVERGRDISVRRGNLEVKLQGLVDAVRVLHAAETELADFAQTLEVDALSPGESLLAAWERLATASAARVADANERSSLHRAAVLSLESIQSAIDRVSTLQRRIAEAAERRASGEGRIREAKRRQMLAKSVRDAALQARARIVQHVFTQSLNDVWKSVFTRLAPREPYVPAFGDPTSTRGGLDISLRTVHKSGDPGGSPQLMLSAGNLNTAALSLFIALHLAVEPLVPCLVFDDPVQAMDEVHVAQFAGLIRMLSKHHGRQVVIAVHERELFEYLALELSPAFAGDELITIELGDRAKDEDGGVTRLKWARDPAIAV